MIVERQNRYNGSFIYHLSSIPNLYFARRKRARKPHALDNGQKAKVTELITKFHLELKLASGIDVRYSAESGAE